MSRQKEEEEDEEEGEGEEVREAAEGIRLR